MTYVTDLKHTFFIRYLAGMFFSRCLTKNQPNNTRSTSSIAPTKGAALFLPAYMNLSPFW